MRMVRRQRTWKNLGLSLTRTAGRLEENQEKEQPLRKTRKESFKEEACSNGETIVEETISL